MSRFPGLAALLLLAGQAGAELRISRSPLPPLPEAVANNAVVGVTAGGRDYVVSFAGLGAGRTWRDVHARTFIIDSAERTWREGAAVPGGVGRLAAAAAAVGGVAYVFGGYTVAENGAERSTPWVHAFDPVTGAFAERARMVVPVDDSVAVTWADRYVYLISGWHDHGNVNLVQRYDASTDSWAQATPVPGSAVFGHAGGIVGDTIVYCDGVAIEAHADRRREFVATNECYAGTIDQEDGRRIDWRTVPGHPGAARYRMAAAGTAGGVLFIGGSENPYNYSGIGYDGEPAEPAAGALYFEIATNSWQWFALDGPTTMDHRGLPRFGDMLLTVGGMSGGQRVTADVTGYRIE